MTLCVWPTDAAWLAWRRSVQSGARPPSALQRAQVAVLLAAGSAARVPSPALAAQLALVLPPEEELPLTFFTGPCGAVTWTEETLGAFRAVVNEYLELARSAAGGPWQAHTLDGVAGAAGDREDGDSDAQASQVWRPSPAGVRALCGSYAAAACTRGLVVLSGTPGEAAAEALRNVRLAAAAKLLVPPQGAADAKTPQWPGPVAEYDPASNTLSLLPPTGAAAAPASAWCTNPAAALAPLKPGAPSVLAVGPPVSPGADLGATAATLAAACAALSAHDALLYAALCHVAGGSDPAAVADALAAQLQLPITVEAAASAGGGPLDAASAGADTVVITHDVLIGKPLVDVGSGLSKADWSAMDDKELVARTRGGGSFKTMQAIKPWSPEALAVAPLLRELAFEYCFLLRREHGTIWRTVCEACFAAEYEAANTDKARKKALSSRTPSAVLEDLRKMKVAGAGTLQWLDALAKAGPDEQLALRRASLRAGPSSAEWAAALLSWQAASGRTKALAMEAQHACTNKTGAPPGSPPMRYKHQEELLSLVDEHLSRSFGKGGAFNGDAQPLRVILSTPTGSGKTFTALMLSLHLLAPKHPGIILVYSVPTKQVLKRVGQECEAHNVVYWTAAKDGDAYQVRRPYSIRTKREKDLGSHGKGSMKEQLDLVHARGKDANDRGAGTPSVIVADVHATAALLAACGDPAQIERNSPFHASRLVLYLDEPNMGIHLSQPALEVVQDIMAKAPHTAVLASATLAPWAQLPLWWRGDPAQAAQRVTITQPPYDLPASRLTLLDGAAGEMRAVAITELFASHGDFMAAVTSDPRTRILLLRHLSPAQANALLAAADADDDTTGSSGAGAAPADDAAAATATWSALQPDVRTSRETLEAALLRLSPARYEALRSSWRETPTRLEAGLGLRGAMSSTGVTMIATLEPRRTALELAGWHPSEGGDGGSDWAERVHAIKSKRRESSRVAAAAAKERERESKRATGGDENGAPPDNGAGAGETQSLGVELRPGLVITHEEADQLDDDTLVMLSRGVSFACADGSEGPLVRRLYQQALLHVPEDVTRLRLPPIHALVVDYSSVYGTDCPAVDTLVLCDDLGTALTFEDNQQFLGRLRRDGKAIFLSAHTLRSAVLGPHVGKADPVLEGALESLQRATRRCVATALGTGATPGQLTAALNTMRKAREPHVPTAHEVARLVLAALLERAYPPLSDVPPAERGAYAPAPAPGVAPAAAAAAAARKLVSTWAPTLAALLKTKADRMAFLRGLEGAAAAPGDHAARLGTLAVTVLKSLYDADVLDEEAILAWAASAKQRADSNGDKPAGALLAKVQAFITWLQEADEDSDEE